VQPSVNRSLPPALLAAAARPSASAGPSIASLASKRAKWFRAPRNAKKEKAINGREWPQSLARLEALR
jgi:hypothetical protein